MTSFVILHYKKIDDTLECIESIKKNKTEEYSIVVVDNGTLNEDEKRIIEKQTPDLICNSENLGFAKGNNIGCSYAINKYQPDFIVVLNNDIILLQNDFISQINICYKETLFDVLGPKIITNGGESVNPFPAYKKMEDIEAAIKKTKKLIKIYKNPILSYLLNSYIFLKSHVVKRKHLENGLNSEYSVSLHGCCLVFSKKYYEKYNNVFYNETFLYHEEEFIEYRREKDNLITYYDSSIEVFHKEGASLNYSFENQERDKLIFRNQEILKSLQLLKEVKEQQRKI